MRQKLLTLILGILPLVGVTADQKLSINADTIQWPEFMKRNDLIWKRLPTSWEQAPYLGNGNIGTMVYASKDKKSIRIQLFRSDVHDHRDNSYGWTAYSRPRFMLGDLYLKPAGKITACDWRFDLWNATLRGTITTDRGEIRFSHLVHTKDMIVYTETETTGNESCSWQWKPGKAETTRGGYPHNEKGKRVYAKRYGSAYLDVLKLHKPNPPVKRETRDGVNLTVQDLLAGGQYAVAWKELASGDKKSRCILSIENTFPETTAADQAVAAVKQVMRENPVAFVKRHTDWWNAYYPASFVSIPDTRLENVYWHQMYKLAAATRADRPMMDTSGPWIQPTPWPYITWDLNVQLCYWPVYPSNRLHLGESLINTLHKNRQTMIENVRPVEWQKDSSYIATVSAQDLNEPRDGDMRYYNAVGHLTWVMHNCWLHYRFTMDAELLREKIFPLLKRGINFYRHMLIEGNDGRLHLPKTYSPEVGEAPDCNYDLALLKWGCRTLLDSATRLKINDPLIPEWKRISEKLVDFPVNKNGFMVGAGVPWSRSHRHYSHLLMAYPLYLVNAEQSPEAKQLIKTSLEHWISFKGALQGYSYTGASSISAAMGNGNDALKYLHGLTRYLQPNGLYKESGPVMETPLSAAQSIHDMLIQSWGGTIRVFPAVADAWNDVVFHDLRAEGAFLVSAVRKDGHTQFVRIKSLAGEPCRIAPNLNGKTNISGARTFSLKEIKPGLFELDLKKGEDVVLWTGTEMPNVTIKPLPAEAGKANSFGLK